MQGRAAPDPSGRHGLPRAANRPRKRRHDAKQRSGERQPPAAEGDALAYTGRVCRHAVAAR